MYTYYFVTVCVWYCVRLKTRNTIIILSENTLPIPLTSFHEYVYIRNNMTIVNRIFIRNTKVATLFDFFYTQVGEIQYVFYEYVFNKGLLERDGA